MSMYEIDPWIDLKGGARLAAANKNNLSFELRTEITTVPPLEMQEYTLYVKGLSHISFTETLLRPGDSRYENL